MSTSEPRAGARHSSQRMTECPVRRARVDAGNVEGRVPRLGAALYGALSYLGFLAAFVYLVGFVENIAVPRSVDHAIDAPLAHAVLVDLGLLGLFAVQHSVMARAAFKRWWTRYIPLPVERSTYVLCTSAALALLFWQWRTIDIRFWQVDWAPGRLALATLGALGWIIALASTFMIDHFELFGLRQAFSAWRSKPLTEQGFRVVWLYCMVRHPLMLGLLLAFWATPTMTVGRLLFASVTTVYVLVALRLEERDLISALGEPYRRYRERVPMLVPCLWSVRRTPGLRGLAGRRQASEQPRALPRNHSDNGGRS